jgi:hypothetical protein
MLNVVMLNVVAPNKLGQYFYMKFFFASSPPVSLFFYFVTTVVVLFNIIVSILSHDYNLP